jgi:predicted AlkP superfamily pyrophosphatase or phosphodiesterase
MEFKRAVLFLVFLYSLVVIVIGTPLSSEVNLSKHPKLVVFSYDGFRFDYMTKTNTPNLDFIKENGVSTAYMTPQFATFTFPNHQSLSTGLNTQSHGVIANSVWDPYYGRVLSGYDNHIEFWKFNEEVYPLWVSPRR